jgi:signal transduction histidine kinase
MRLSVRLALVFSLFGIGIAGGFQYRHVTVLRQESYARAENMAQVTLSAVSVLVSAQAQGGRFKDLGRNLQMMVRQSGIAGILVLDAKGKILLKRIDDLKFVGRKPHPGLRIGETTDGVYDVQTEADLGPLGRGTVLVGFHTAALEERLRAIEARAVQSGVTAFLAITLAGWFIGMWFGLRIERIVPRIEALPRSPERFRPMRRQGSDEVGRLVAAFNKLGAGLRTETLRRHELEAEKSELSAMLVHDLKTPLTVILSGISLLQDQIGERSSGRDNTASLKRTFELLNTSADRLQRMIEDVLQLSRLEEMPARLGESVDVAATARAVAKDFELVAQGRGQSMALDAPRGLELPVTGDASLLRRVLDNLVHNAVEHTPAGGVITIRAWEEEGSARLSVSDSGPGIPVSARDSIFKKFFQQDMKQHVGNVGLGLALCQKVIDRHGGSIRVESAEPRGACFSITLPLNREEA